MMKYEYKNTEIEWLYNVPRHWKVDRIKDKTTAVVGGDWGNDPESDMDGENIVVLRVADLDDIYFKFEDLTIRKIKNGSFKSRKVTDRCLVIEKSGGGEKQFVGRTGYPLGIDFDAICSNFMAKIEFDNTINLKFANYLFTSLYNSNLNFPYIQQTTGIQNLNVTYYLTSKAAFPPLPEQKAIADYLDKACQRIDSIIEIKQNQLEFLESNQTSKLFSMLTRGLKVNVEFKKPEIHWMAQMPKLWKKKRIKDVVRLKSGDSITSTDINEFDEFPVYGGNGLRGYTNSYTHEGEFALIGRQGALCGNINYARGKFWASEHAVVATPIHPCSTIWIGELLRIMDLNQYSNAAAQPGLAVERIKQLYIPVPPFKEQIEIVNQIEKLVTMNRKIKENIENQITTLRTCRKSLIHECVTGKKQVWEGEIKN